MTDSTVLSFEDAVRVRSARAPAVIDPQALKDRQGVIPSTDCHIVFDKVTIVKKLKTQEITVYHDLSIGFPKGRKIAILGHRDAGKQTIYDAVHRKIVPRRGQILLNTRVSWPIPAARFYEIKSTVKQNIVFFARVLDVPPHDMMAAYVDFCQLDQRILKEPIRNLPDWAMRRLGILLLLYCDFDFHMIRGSFRMEGMRFNSEQETVARELIFGRDYVVSCDQVKNIPDCCNLLYVLYGGRFYQFEDITEGVALFNTLPKPKKGPARDDGDDDDQEEDEYREEMVF